NLNDLVNGVLATLTPLASSRKVSLSNALPDNLPLARANRVVLRQAMLGLVSFAIQRLSAGSVVIKSNGDPDARLWVQASGTGQGGEPSKVGLEVSRKLVASLGGEVKMAETVSTWQAEISLPAAEEMPLLVMDDNAGLIELYRRYLARRGYRVFEAHSSDEAIEIAEKQPLRLIILDVMMPEQDGWEVLQRLKCAPAAQTVPVMICSVLDETEMAQVLGASDYLRKPVTQEALLAKVEHWCRGPLSPAGAPPTGPAHS
ncbi:MAG TPA: response regulator, partial [Anaerolineaceae bacterium]|nr:response regulator [Anaerolineaceae bacterium]